METTDRETRDSDAADSDVRVAGTVKLEMSIELPWDDTSDEYMHEFVDHLVTVASQLGSGETENGLHRNTLPYPHVGYYEITWDENA